MLWALAGCGRGSGFPLSALRWGRWAVCHLGAHGAHMVSQGLLRADESPRLLFGSERSFHHLPLPRFLSMSPPAGELLFHGPVFVSEPSNSMVPVGSEDKRVTLSCEARGNPAPRYRYGAESDTRVERGGGGDGEFFESVCLRRWEEIPVELWLHLVLSRPDV